jgi:hypothetical protein
LEEISCCFLESAGRLDGDLLDELLEGALASFLEKFHGLS